MNLNNDFPFRQDLFDFPCRNFKNHLQLPSNNRIIFSGKFGIGKSFFLDHFFKNEVQIQTLSDVKYRSFHIFPVNYSIASNEDVYDYIKYDVIISMLANGIVLQENDYKVIDYIPNYLKNNFLRVLENTIYMIPKVGKDIGNIYEHLKKTKKDFDAYANNKMKTEGDTLTEFLMKIEKRDKSIFENGIVTKLICAILSRLKKETNLENVLIVDDLDRIDPEHIFRLLNIFAAHLDDTTYLKNRLGFDKIIFVCDINNIRNIFRTKYGNLTDFNGYIDKFYSHEIFRFDTRKALLEISSSVFGNLKPQSRDDSTVRYFRSLIFKRQNVCTDLLSMFIDNGLISLRTLISKSIKGIEIDTERLYMFDELMLIRYTENPFLLSFKILKDIIGDYETIKEYSNRIPLRAYTLRDINLYANQLVYFVYYENTLRANKPVLINFNSKLFYLDVPIDHVNEKLHMLVLRKTNSSGESETNLQYDYNISEFKMLLSDFLDLLGRID